jgi:demethylmenaquinone methyltransferase / 2-methoxy-6-polyprenyl-1,4-benzoquinol methylase
LVLTVPAPLVRNSDRNAHTEPLQLGTLDVDAHLADPAIKQRFVTPMFDLVAPRYDDFTKRFSFGMDVKWKHELCALALAVAPTHATCADVACGTGDLAFLLACKRPDLRITGIDASRRMLTRAAGRRLHLGATAVEFAAGDLARLSFPDASLDLVTAGYGVRNAPSWRLALAELARVIRPGGHLFTLDFFLPQSRAWRALFLWYLRVMGNVYGWLWHREPVAYGYIARSIARFASAREFTAGLEANGFHVVDVRQHLGGGIAIHHAVRTDG